jgi:hypothetical protein
VNLQLSPSAVQEAITVTGAAPLLDVTSSSLGGNVDPRQTQELPVNGRDWLALSTLAPGMRANATDLGPTTGERLGNREFQLNIDGQEVSVAQGGNRGQPRFSRDAIAEFQYLSSRFDATQGRSTGIQVNAITKSGANTASGSFSGYFRDDAFNAADFVSKTVLPYSNQQFSGTYGGPILRDRLHYFANYEYERERSTVTFNTPYPKFNVPLTGTRRTDMAGLRLDYQFSSRTRLMTRGNMFTYTNPYEGAADGATGRRSPGGRGELQAAQRGALWHPDAGADRPDAERDQGGLQQPLLQNRELHVPSRSPAGGRGYRVRSPPYHVQGLPDWRERPDAAE